MHFQNLLWFVTVHKLSCALQVQRGKQDLVQKVDLNTCEEFNGSYQGGKCQCPRTSPTFFSAFGFPRCRNTKATTNCQLLVRENFTSISDIIRNETSSSKTDTICAAHAAFLWEPCFECKKTASSWTDITLILKSYFNNSNEQGAQMSHTYQGSLIKIELSCAKKCLLIKLKGLSDKMEFRQTLRLPNNSENHPRPSSAVPDVVHHVGNQTWIKFGIIVAIVSIMCVMCVIIGAALHVCQLRVGRRKKRSGSETARCGPQVGMEVELTAEPYKKL